MLLSINYKLIENILNKLIRKNVLTSLFNKYNIIIVLLLQIF